MSESAAHRPWCVPQECRLVPGTAEGVHLGPASVLVPAEGGGQLAVRLAETVSEEPGEVGVLVELTERTLDTRGTREALVDQALDVELTVGEVLALIGLLAGVAADAQRR